MKYLLLICTVLVVFACGSDDNGNNPNNNNPNVNQPPVNFSINLTLPEYNVLLFPGNSVTFNGQGVRGVVVYNVNNTLYTAFDLTDPNHAPNNCSKMTVEGIIATCQCNDDNSYDIVTGQHQSSEQSYPMLQYFVQRDGDVITVSN